MLVEHKGGDWIIGEDGVVVGSVSEEIQRQMPENAPMTYVERGDPLLVIRERIIKLLRLNVPVHGR